MQLPALYEDKFFKQVSFGTFQKSYAVADVQPPDYSLFFSVDGDTGVVKCVRFYGDAALNLPQNILVVVRNAARTKKMP